MNTGSQPLPRDEAATNRAKAILGGLGMAAVSAALGYVCGLVRGEGNLILLAVCFGTAGAVVGLLGYGWIVGIFAALARLLGRCRPRRNQVSAPEHEPEKRRFYLSRVDTVVRKVGEPPPRWIC